MSLHILRCLCVYVSVHTTWIDLDKWIFVKTFQVSILASLSLIEVSNMLNQWIYFIFHYKVSITLENRICIQTQPVPQNGNFFKKLFNRKYAKLKIHVIKKSFFVNIKSNAKWKTIQNIYSQFQLYHLWMKRVKAEKG